MRMLAKPFICLVLSLVLVGWPGAAAAQGFKWWQNDRFQQELALTSEQVDRLEEIFQALQPTLKTQKETLDKYETKLSKVVSDPRADEALVLQAVEKTGRGAGGADQVPDPAHFPHGPHPDQRSKRQTQGASRAVGP